MVRVLYGMGSNLGDRSAHLRGAVDALAGGAAAGARLVGVSDVYETEPVGGPDQGAFLNLVVLLEDPAPAPFAHLATCQALEAAAARVRVERWGPRTLDVDLLWIDGVTVEHPDLVVPHPRLFERRFVLAPLAELAPDLVPEAWEDGAVGAVTRLGPLP